MAINLTYVTASVFKIVWWLAAAWLFSGLVRAVLVFKKAACGDAVSAGTCSPDLSMWPPFLALSPMFSTCL